MKESKLLVTMFETARWQELLDRATEKEIDLTTIKKLCDPEERMKLFTVIAQDKYNIFPPHIATTAAGELSSHRKNHSVHHSEYRLV